MNIYDSFESIQRYLEVVHSSSYTDPGRFSAENIKDIESKNFSIAHHSFIEGGRVLSVSDEHIEAYSEKYEGFHSIILKHEKPFGFIFYDQREGEEKNADPVKKLLKREPEKNEKWFIMKHDKFTSIGLIEEKDLNANISKLIDLLETLISRNYPHLNIRLSIAN